ncbi:MAG: AMP-binding protein [Candidatus Yanofskybacteria bacterium]|nr:AMP-binding protein [Candidatus Yanofskybacteria bacterium]
MADIITTLFEKEEELRRKGHQLPALVLLKKDGTKEKYSWEDYLHCHAFSAAIALQDLNLVDPSKSEKENFVAIVPVNLPESFFTILGIIMAGGVPVPIHPMLLKEPDKVKAILDHCQPKITLISECLADEYKENGHTTITVEQLLALGKKICKNKGVKRLYHNDKVRNPNRLLIMPYTSGTTGGPKGVMLSHENILDRTKAVIKALQIGPEDRVLSYMTLGHISELIASFFGQLIGGYTVYFTEFSTDREKLKEKFTSILKRVRPTAFLGVPKVWINIETGVKEKLKLAGKLAGLVPIYFLKDKIKQELGLDHTRIAISAGSEISRHEINFFRKLGLNIMDIYGQTETAGPLLLNGAVIGNTNQVFLEPFSKEIVVTGKAVMLGYYNNPKANENHFEEKIYQTHPPTEEPLRERLYHTEDTGKFNFSNKTISITGRIGEGYKTAQGEYVTGESIQKLEQEVKDKIRDVDPQAEVVICGKNKPYQIALIFLNNRPSDKKGLAKLHETLKSKTGAIGKGLMKIGNIAILSSQTDLILTPTLKPRKKEIIEKFKKLIDEL